MNNQKASDEIELKILNEFTKEPVISQRAVADRIGIALGLVNSYIKHLAKKGYLNISNISKNNYKYLLTPKGISEKTRLTYQLLRDYNIIFKEARRDYGRLFHALCDSGIRNIAFAGVDEVAEIAYLSLQEVDIKLVGVMDDKMAGKKFFKTLILPFSSSDQLDFDGIAITSYHRKNDIYKGLIDSGIAEEAIKSIYPISYRPISYRKAQVSWK